MLWESGIIFANIQRRLLIGGIFSLFLPTLTFLYVSLYSEQLFPLGDFMIWTISSKCKDTVGGPYYVIITLMDFDMMLKNFNDSVP